MGIVTDNSCDFYNTDCPIRFDYFCIGAVFISAIFVVVDNYPNDWCYSCNIFRFY